MKTLPRAVNRLNCLVFNIQLDSMCILIFVCSENIATCLRQISNRQAGIVNYIRDTEQATEKQLFKNQQSCFREQNKRLWSVLFTRFYYYLNWNRGKKPGFFLWMALLKKLFSKITVKQKWVSLHTSQSASSSHTQKSQ